MDLNFYSDLSDGTTPQSDPEFLDSQSYNGYDSGNKFPGGSDSYLTISGGGHTFLSSSETFHTPSLGDEEFEIPPISLDPDSALAVSDVVGHFAELSDGSVTGDPSGTEACVRSAVVGGNDPSFASTFVNPPSQGLERLTLGVMNQSAGGSLLSSTLGMDLGQSIGSHFSSSSPMTIDVPLSDMNHSLLGHNQLTTIDQSELSAQLGLSLGGGTILPRSQSPDQPLSATPSPTGSLQGDDMDDFRQKSVLVDSPVSLSVSPAVISLSPSLSGSPLSSSSIPPPALVPGGLRSGGGKPAMASSMGSGTSGGGLTTAVGKKGKKKKDPNEPQKPVSAYALFFRDTQAAIKGQNPNATFGEVSKIVASMWDSLGEEQKQVYKRKTEAAKKEYLKALAAYRANQLSQTSIEVMDTSSSPPPPPPAPLTSVMPIAPATPAVPAAPIAPSPPAPSPVRPTRIPHHAPDQNTITNICTSNIILDLPQVTTRSRTGAHKPPIPSPVPPTVTKIIISKQVLAAGGAQIHQIPTSVVTVIPARALPAAIATPAARQPPPLQQMQHAPLPPRLQQMVHSPAPPPLQAKPRGGGVSTSVTATPPPPLQIKIVPAPVQAELATPIVVTTAAVTAASPVASSVPVPAASTRSLALEVEESATMVTSCTVSAAEDVAETEEFTSGEMEVELNVSPGSEEPLSAPPRRCVRAGCTNPPVESKDWDREYCSNECVATHCKDVFMAWCSIRSQNSTTIVK
ncbi:TOX high mobility group box family member 4-A isoform X1 [Brienomyrus brachyistius]|uniref:TOX high mobility group box family member 4-A isoform X1 n=1 Tax=Brienomyrus brachyistius TaxID=42636 RepID=UPI0020B31A98|nr:TOX high mobility group box family member 4-A isoform X1 [Brienomyrus brachyistius]